MIDALLQWLGLVDLIPEGPVLTPGARSEQFGRELSSGVQYTSPPRSRAPIVPLQVFGVAYDLDLMLVSDHPSWNMHEYALVTTPDGPLWLAKDAREHTLEQSIVAEHADLDTWLPEVPVRRQWSRVTVDDASTAAGIDVALKYTNMDGEPTELTWRGPHPTKLETRRNSSTMGHSRDAALVALDLSHKAPAHHVQLKIDGKVRQVTKIAKIVPMQFALIQAQGGFGVGRWRQHDTQHGFETMHDGPVLTRSATQRWQLVHEPGYVLAKQCQPTRTLTYRFREQGESLELLSVSVHQYGRATPVCTAQFNPALPDMRRRFEGSFRGAYVLDINGQQSHAIGEILASGGRDHATISILPTQPRWTKDRPLQAHITWDGAKAQIEMTRIQEES